MGEQVNKMIEAVSVALNALKTEVNIYYAARDREKEERAQRIAFLDNRDKELDLREAKVKDIENIVTAKAEAEKLAKDARELMGKAVSEMDKFQDWAKKERQDIAKMRTDAISLKNETSAEHKALEARMAAFEKEKTEWKEKAAKALVGEM